MSNEHKSERTKAKPRYKWPWFVLGAIVLGVVLAILWMICEIQRTKSIREGSEVRSPKEGRNPKQGRRARQHFGVPQSSAAFEPLRTSESGRGLPHSKTLARPPAR